MKKRMHYFKGQSKRQSKKKLIATGLVSAVLLGVVTPSGFSQVSAEETKDTPSKAVNTRIKWIPNSIQEIQSTVSQVRPGTDYTIHWGDTLSGISAVVDISIADLAEANTIQNVDLIYVEDALVIDKERVAEEIGRRPQSAEANESETTAPAKAPRKNRKSRSNSGKRTHKTKSKKHHKHSRKNRKKHRDDRVESKRDSSDEEDNKLDMTPVKNDDIYPKEQSDYEDHSGDSEDSSNNTYEQPLPEETPSGQEPDTSEEHDDSEQPSVPTPEETEQPDEPKESEEETPQQASTKEQAALDAVNELRSKNNLPPLVYNEQLGDAAQVIAENNHNNNGLTHNHDDAAVEASSYTGDSALANLGYNSAGTTAEGSVNQLYGSPGHRKQMLAPYWTEFGYGEVTGPNGTYFTQFFGTQDIQDIPEYNSYNNYIGADYSNPTIPLDSYNGQ